MNRFLYKVAGFFQGRYGIDKLFYGICGVAVFLGFVNLFTRSLILQLVIYGLFILAVLRCLSTNRQKRYAENQKFEAIFGKVSKKVSFESRKFKERKTHIYCKCPSCKKNLRLKKVKGEHTVSCPNCGNRFKIKI